MSVDYISVNNTKAAETACVKREPIPLIVDETYKILCEREAMVSRITEIVKGEALPFSETAGVKCLIDAVMRNREFSCRLSNALGMLLDEFNS